MMFMQVASGVSAEELRVAVASNFVNTLDQLAQKFEASSGHKVVLIPGSSGKHFAQIINGAPFDLFFAADSERPIQLEKQGYVVKDSRFTYASGQLVLWNPVSGLPVRELLNNLNVQQKLAIANPILAPYGEAAKQTLQYLGLWTQLQNNLVRGENIAQTFQFVKSGNATLALVSLAQVKHLDYGTSWMVPKTYHLPIQQQAVQIKGKNAARAFMQFVQTEDSLRLIRDAGYLTLE